MGGHDGDLYFEPVPHIINLETGEWTVAAPMLEVQFMHICLQYKTVFGLAFFYLQYVLFLDPWPSGMHDAQW